jgi:hypothetical protein
MDEAIDYKAVLADLKARRDALNKVIEGLEAFAGLGVLTNYNVFTPKVTEVNIDSFVGLNIPEASAKYLRMVGKPARTTTEITEMLNKGGLACSQGSVATVLGRDFTKQSGEVVRVSKGIWGLAEWYPGRPRTKRRDSGDDEEPPAETNNDN